MKIAMGCDHAGYELKVQVAAHLRARGFEIVDFGTNSTESVNYPVYGYLAAKAVSEGVCDIGVIICGTGVGISLAANKVHGIRCCACSDVFTATLTKRHNNSNMLALGARVVGPGLAMMIVDEWLDAKFEGGRHQKRVDMIMEIDETGELKLDD